LFRHSSHSVSHLNDTLSEGLEGKDDAFLCCFNHP
jgi:hypothetical protein